MDNYDRGIVKKFYFWKEIRLFFRLWDVFFSIISRFKFSGKIAFLDHSNKIFHDNSCRSDVWHDHNEDFKMKKGLFSGIKEGFEGFGKIITTIVNFFLLLLVYIVGVGITSILAKLGKKEILSKKLHQEKSYWSDLNLNDSNIERYYRQF